LVKSSVNELFEEIDKEDIVDMVVCYRTKKGAIASRWIGDTLACATMSSLLAKDIANDICEMEED
jgi:hypothetical protein